MTFCILILITFECADPEEKQPYVPKRFRPSKQRWIKSTLKTMIRSTDPFFKAINTMKVHRKYHSQRLRSGGPRRLRSRKVPRECPQYNSIPAMTTTWANGVSKTPPGRQFDSDSRVHMLDDGASACITNDKSDFIEPPTKVNRKVRGIKGHANATHRGTIKWHVEDDTGLIHIMIIRGAYLIPEAATRIVSPQHLAQQVGDHYPKEEGTGALTTSKTVTLFWSQRRFTKTVPLDQTTNVGLTTTASRCSFFSSILREDRTAKNQARKHIYDAHHPG